MNDFFDRCKLCLMHEQCEFADTPMSCAWDVVMRDGVSAIERSVSNGESCRSKDTYGSSSMR